jgi:hypothetical protein
MVMKEPRVEKIVDDLKVTVERLNRLTEILAKSGTTFHLGRSQRDGPFTLDHIEQRVEY